MTLRTEGKMSLIGTDTFRGTSTSSTLLRTQLYEKNLGDVAIERSGLVRTNSPISGNLLISTHGASHRLRDPTAGSVLQYSGRRAVVTAPLQKQQARFSRGFYATKDVDITIQTLRNTTKVSRYTNEKVGTAGTPTGMDRSLSAYKEAK